MRIGPRRRLLPGVTLVLVALTVGVTPAAAVDRDGARAPVVVAAGGVGADPAVVVTTDLAYGEAPDEAGAPETLRLDLYDPTAAAGTRPALVVVHGGGFDRGDKADPVYVAMAGALAARGFVVAVVNYRLRTDAYPDFPVASVDAQHDVQAAVRWLRAHAADLRLDPARIAVTGHSAGAIAALRVGTHPDDPGSSGTPDQTSTVAAVLAVSGFLPGGPGTAAPPLRLLHGAEDPLIPLTWADETCKQWGVAGGDCDLVVYEGASHDATTFFDPSAPEVVEFLACTVGGPVAFADVAAGSARARTVAWATGVGVLNGAVPRAFEPAATVTRGQFAAWTWRWTGRPAVEGAARLGGDPSVDWVVAEGVLHTRRDGTFAARRGLSRSAAALALWRLAGRPSAPPSGVEGLDPVAKEAPAVDWLVAQGADGLLVGGRFRGDAPLRRAQLLAVLRQLSAAPPSARGGAVTECPAV